MAITFLSNFSAMLSYACGAIDLGVQNAAVGSVVRPRWGIALSGF